MPCTCWEFPFSPHQMLLQVVAVTAVRTGAGKSQVSHFCSSVLTKHKLKVVLVRHPMPYVSPWPCLYSNAAQPSQESSSNGRLLCVLQGDLKEERVQRFQNYADLRRHKVTIEEREEYEQHLKEGVIVYAGVDYKAILEEVKCCRSSLHHVHG